MIFAFGDRTGKGAKALYSFIGYMKIKVRFFSSLQGQKISPQPHRMGFR